MEAPELVVTQGDWALLVEEWCGRARVPFVLRVQSYELLCSRPTLIDLCRAEIDACQCSETEMRTRRRVLSTARLVLADSAFVAEEVRRWSGQEPEVFYELVDPARCRPHDGLRLGTIVMNQADYHKGFLVFRTLARMLPAERLCRLRRSLDREPDEFVPPRQRIVADIVFPCGYRIGAVAVAGTVRAHRGGGVHCRDTGHRQPSRGPARIHGRQRSADR